MCVVLKLPFHTLKSLINEQGGYVVFLVLSEYSFIRDFRVAKNEFEPRIINTTIESIKSR